MKQGDVNCRLMSPSSEIDDILYGSNKQKQTEENNIRPQTSLLSSKRALYLEKMRMQNHMRNTSKLEFQMNSNGIFPKTIANTRPVSPKDIKPIIIQEEASDNNDTLVFKPLAQKETIPQVK